MQPNHQIVQEQISVHGDGNVVIENTAGPAAAASKVNRIGARDMVCHRSRGGASHLHGEAHFISLASAAVNPSAAPKEHALGNRREDMPIFLILYEWMRPTSTQA